MSKHFDLSLFYCILIHRSCMRDLGYSQTIKNLTSNHTLCKCDMPELENINHIVTQCPVYEKVIENIWQ